MKYQNLLENEGLAQEKVYDLYALVKLIKEDRKEMGSIEDDEDRQQYVYHSEKLNEIRSYLVYLSKLVECEKDKIRNEIAFYDFNQSHKES